MYSRIFAIAALAASTMGLRVCNQAGAPDSEANIDFSGYTDCYVSVTARLDEAYPGDEDIPITEDLWDAQAMGYTWDEVIAASYRRRKPDALSKSSIISGIETIERDEARDRGQQLAEDIFTATNQGNSRGFMVSSSQFIREVAKRDSYKSASADWRALMAFSNKSGNYARKDDVVDYYRESFALGKDIQQGLVKAQYEARDFSAEFKAAFWETEAPLITAHYIRKNADFDGKDGIEDGEEWNAAVRLFPRAANPLTSEDFYEMDQDGSNSVSFWEMRQFAKSDLDYQRDYPLRQPVLEMFELLDGDQSGAMTRGEFFSNEKVICEILNEDCSTGFRQRRLFKKAADATTSWLFTQTSTQEELNEYIDGRLQETTGDLYYMQNEVLFLIEQEPGKGVAHDDLKEAVSKCKSDWQDCDFDAWECDWTMLDDLCNATDCEYDLTLDEIDSIFNPLLEAAESYDFVGDGVLHRVDVLAYNLNTA